MKKKICEGCGESIKYCCCDDEEDDDDDDDGYIAPPYDFKNLADVNHALRISNPHSKQQFERMVNYPFNKLSRLQKIFFLVYTLQGVKGATATAKQLKQMKKVDELLAAEKLKGKKEKKAIVMKRLTSKTNVDFIVKELTFFAKHISELPSGLRSSIKGACDKFTCANK